MPGDLDRLRPRCHPRSTHARKLGRRALFINNYELGAEMPRGKIKPDDERALRNHYLDLIRSADRGKSYFEHVGLPVNTTWKQWRSHYDRDGKPDIDKAAHDLATYPPIIQGVFDAMDDDEI